VNLLNLVDQQSTILIVAAASTLILIAGGIDLSVGAVFALSGIVAVQVSNSSGVIPGVAAALVTGLVVGLINGLLVTIMNLAPMIATLATSYIFAGIASVVAAGSVQISTLPDFRLLGTTRFGPVALTTLIAIVAVAAIWFLLSASTYGRSIYAVGGNDEAARLSGIRVDSVRISTYVLTGLMAALAGVMSASRVGSMQADIGGQTSLMFTVLVGVVVGGTSLMGGEGAVWRTVVGVLFIAVIHNGFVLLSLDGVYEQIIVGTLIVIAVAADSLRQRRRH
jgi:ribose transport system permease protein